LAANGRLGRTAAIPVGPFGARDMDPTGQSTNNYGAVVLSAILDQGRSLLKICFRSWMDLGRRIEKQGESIPSRHKWRLGAGPIYRTTRTAESDSRFMDTSVSENCPIPGIEDRI
jgi:hypothetical protein